MARFGICVLLFMVVTIRRAAADSVRMIYGAHNGPTLSHSVIVPAPNGKLYAPPPNNGQILVIDPVSNSFNLLTERTYSGGYAAAALADNGKIYAPPYGAQQVLVIDTSTDTATLLMDQTFLSNRWLYRTAILAPNGKIYAMPFLATQVLVIDPSSDTSELLVGSFSGNIWWVGGGVRTIPGGFPGRQRCYLCCPLRCRICATRGHHKEHCRSAC